MSANTRLRVGAGLGHLLLVVVLAFGVFSMHTLGHLDGAGHGGGMGTAQHTVTAHVHTDTVTDGADDATGSATHTTAVRSDSPSADEPPSGMNALSVCLAVLTAALTALFLRAALARSHGRAAELFQGIAVGARVVHLHAPPGRRVLAELSVLRT